MSDRASSSSAKEAQYGFRAEESCGSVIEPSCSSAHGRRPCAPRWYLGCYSRCENV